MTVWGGGEKRRYPRYRGPVRVVGTGAGLVAVDNPLSGETDHVPEAKCEPVQVNVGDYVVRCAAGGLFP